MNTRYYFNVYYKCLWFSPCVYTSELFDSKASALKSAKDCEDENHYAMVFEYTRENDLKV